MTTQIDTAQFKQTEVIKSLKSKQSSNEPLNNESSEMKTKGKRGRKPKYFTDEDRINARRQQQKAYRERKKKEFNDLKALHAEYLKKNKTTTE